jgi:hypothetical protein
MEDERIPELIKPVHPPVSQTGKDQAPVLALYLNGIDVNDQGKKGNDIPLKLASVSQYLQSSCG